MGNQISLEKHGKHRQPTKELNGTSLAMLGMGHSSCRRPQLRHGPKPINVRLWPKQTWASALHMSAFKGKADMTFCGISFSRSLLGVKRTSLVAAHMSAFDPKRSRRASRPGFPL